jgi:hypothetical protein
VLFAVWALAGLYGALGPALVHALTGSGNVVLGPRGWTTIPVRPQPPAPPPPPCLTASGSEVPSRVLCDPRWPGRVQARPAIARGLPEAGTRNFQAHHAHGQRTWPLRVLCLAAAGHLALAIGVPVSRCWN